MTETLLETFLVGGVTGGVMMVLILVWQAVSDSGKPKK